MRRCLPPTLNLALTHQASSIATSTAVQQIIGREGETATLLSRSFFNSELRVIGFAPRQFGRWAATL